MQIIRRFVRYQERVSGVPGRVNTPDVQEGRNQQVAVLGI